jgi:hypothetical protein
MRSSNQGSKHHHGLEFDLQGKSCECITFSEEILEQKIRRVAEGMIRQSTTEMNSKMNDRSKNLRDYMEVQIQKNEASHSRETSQNR